MIQASDHLQSQDPLYSLTSSIPQEGNSAASGDYRINSLLSGYKWGVTTISYSFYSGGAYYGSASGLGIVSDGIKNNVRNILNNVIAPLININFVEVSDSASSYGQIRYLVSTSSDYANTFYPFSTDANQGNGNDVAGDVFLNPAYDNSSGINGFQGGPGTHGYQTLIHETLHALGLKHAGNYNVIGFGDPPYLPYGEENWDNTIMTYNFDSGAEPTTPMPYDVLALQYLYGAKSFNANNTTYTFSFPDFYSDGLRTVGSRNFDNKLTIWDSDGIDTLNFATLVANASGYRFDLNAGGWLSTQTAFNGSGYNAIPGPPISFTSGTSYYATNSGTRLGYGVTIENLINSSSSDYIIANSVANVFSGYGATNTTGNDIIESANNFDTLDLSAFAIASVTQTQIGNNLLLGIGSGRSITIKDYYAVPAASRIQIGFANLRPPTNLTLSNNVIAENQAIATPIGTFSSTDPDTGNTFTYSLVTGTGDTDNALFTITGNQLQSNGIFDFETKNSYNIRVKTTDQGGLTFEKELAIAVTNLNEAPTITSGVIATFIENGTGTVYTVKATDPDASTTLTYSISGTDVSLFDINSNTGAIGFKTAPSFAAPADSGANNIYDINVIASDGSLSDTKALAINVIITPPFNIINGTESSETLLGTSEDDLIFGLGGDDVLLGLGGNNILVGGSGNNILVGGDGNNILAGGDEKDLLIGGDSDDLLVGGDSDDLLIGRGGNDVLVGGNGNDFFAFSANGVFNLSKIGQDIIADFDPANDKIVLDKITFNSLLSIVGNGFSQSSEFAVVTTDAEAQTSGALITYNNTNGNLFYNQNGAANGFGIGGLFANLNTNPNLSASNFLIAV